MSIGSAFNLLLRCLFIAIISAEVFIKTTKLECFSNPKYITNHSCYLKAVSRYQALSSINITFRQPVHNITYNAALYIRNDANIYNPYLVNVTQNLCWVLGNKLSSVYSKIFIKLLSEFSNVNHKCPYAGTIIVKNFYVDAKVLPLLSIPQHSYRVDLIYYEGLPIENMCEARFFFDIVEPRKKNLFAGK